MERIYTGYVANPSNNEESCLIIDYHNMELKEIYFMDVALWSDVFHKDFVNKLYYFGNLPPNKTVEKRAGDSRNICNVEYPCHELKTSQID